MVYVLADTEQGSLQELTGLVTTDNRNCVYLQQDLCMHFTSLWYPTFHKLKTEILDLYLKCILLLTEISTSFLGVFV